MDRCDKKKNLNIFLYLIPVIMDSIQEKPLYRAWWSEIDKDGNYRPVPHINVGTKPIHAARLAQSHWENESSKNDRKHSNGHFIMKYEYEPTWEKMDEDVILLYFEIPEDIIKDFMNILVKTHELWNQDDMIGISLPRRHQKNLLTIWCGSNILRIVLSTVWQILQDTNCHNDITIRMEYATNRAKSVYKKYDLCVYPGKQCKTIPLGDASKASAIAQCSTHR
jgi:hypothetical protein